MHRTVAVLTLGALLASSVPSRAQPVEPADPDAAGAAAFGAVVGGVLGGLAGAALTRRHHDDAEVSGRGRAAFGGEGGRPKGGAAHPAQGPKAGGQHKGGGEHRQRRPDGTQ